MSDVQQQECNLFFVRMDRLELDRAYLGYFPSHCSCNKAKNWRDLKHIRSFVIGIPINLLAYQRFALHSENEEPAPPLSERPLRKQF